MKNNEPERSLIAEHVRRRLFCVFHVFYSRDNKTTALERNIDLSNPKNFKNRRRTTVIDGRKITLKTQFVRATESTRFKCSSVLLSELNYSHMKWSRAVRNINVNEQSWIYYCYGDKLDFDYQIIICRHVWSEFILNQQKKIRSSTIELLKNLTWLAVQHAVKKINYNYDYYDSKTLAKLTNKSVSCWCENYNDYWHQLLNICYQLDERALINVERQQRNNQ
jgi:hypothetical protein